MCELRRLGWSISDDAVRGGLAAARPRFGSPRLGVLLRQEMALKCSEYPNPRCDPNTDPDCFCDPYCNPDLDPECVICEDQCAGPASDPIG